MITSMNLAAMGLGGEANPIGIDPGGRSRVSQLTTLFDGKTLGVDDTSKWHTIGTGTPTFQDNKMLMGVTSGQYIIRQSKYFCPYFSGKPQYIENTFDHFQAETGITKRVGYFSSNAVAPYNSNLDGWYLESSNNSYKLVVTNNGVANLDLDWTKWDAYNELKTYDWSKFTVVFVDFLWLGGAILRLFIKLPNGTFILAHQHNFAGRNQDVFMKSPQHPVRYEIRSSSGSGSFRAICSQVATEGSISERGATTSIFNLIPIATNTVSTVYALKGIRKLSTFRDVTIRTTSFGGSIAGATNDAGIILLLLNPTLSAPLTWTTNGRFEEGTATTQTISSIGRVIAAVQTVSAGVDTELAESMLAELPIDITNVPGEIILAYTPLTANQTVSGVISVMEY